jgi:hypothetical protein
VHLQQDLKVQMIPLLSLVANAAGSIGGWIIAGIGGLVLTAYKLLLGFFGIHIPNNNRDCQVGTYDVDANDPADSPVYFLSGALVLLVNDFWLLLRQWWTLPLVFWPFPMVGDDLSWSGLIAQVGMTTGSIVITLFVILVPTSIPAVVLGLWVLLKLVRSAQGSVRVNSTAHGARIPPPDAFRHEAWLW